MDSAKVQALVTRLRKGGNVLLGIADELEACLTDSPTPGQEAKRFLEWFGCEWGRVRRGLASYTFAWNKDTAIVKRLLKTVPLDDLKVRATKYLKSQEAFVVENGHTIALFAGQINRYIDEQPMQAMFLTAPPVAGCQHSPKCESDQQHTRKRAQEMRANA